MMATNSTLNPVQAVWDLFQPAQGHPSGQGLIRQTGGGNRLQASLCLDRGNGIDAFCRLQPDLRVFVGEQRQQRPPLVDAAALELACDGEQNVEQLVTLAHIISQIRVILRQACIPKLINQNNLLAIAFASG